MKQRWNHALSLEYRDGAATGTVFGSVEGGEVPPLRRSVSSVVIRTSLVVIVGPDRWIDRRDE